MRCGQPLCGPNQKRCREDVHMLNHCLQSRGKGRVVDCRSVEQTKQHAGKGEFAQRLKLVETIVGMLTIFRWRDGDPQPLSTVEVGTRRSGLHSRTAGILQQAARRCVCMEAGREMCSDPCLQCVAMSAYGPVLPGSADWRPQGGWAKWRNCSELSRVWCSMCIRKVSACYTR